MNMDAPTRADLRRGLEKKILTYMMADTYEKFPAKLAQERGMTFTPLPPLVIDRSNPAVNCGCMLMDHDGRDPSPQKGNLLISDTEEGEIKNHNLSSYDDQIKKSVLMYLLDWTQTCNLNYDLTNKYQIKLNIITVLDGEFPTEKETITKLLTVDRQTTMKEFYHETASIPILMKGRSLDESYTSIVYAIEDNRFNL